ncbi:MAG: diguanylate cyclase [candidate division WS1 bacterium]|nr:diguanylate cyclase [candidate division WS1 bacterium]
MMNYPLEQPWGDDMLSPQQAEDVVEQLAAATDVLDLLRRADHVSPPEIDLWSILVVGDPGELYVHSPAPITPTLALALAHSMADELAGCVRTPLPLGRIEHARLSCVSLEMEVLGHLCDSFHDHLTQRGSEVIGVTRAAASAADGLTLGRWREADEVLEVAAWMLGALTDPKRSATGLMDPISGLYTRGFFEQTLRNELARHQRIATEMSVVLLQLRRSASLLADERPAPSLLAVAGGLMRRELREADVIARLDSRRLAALLPFTSPRNGLIAATRLGEAMQDVAELEGWSIDIGVSGIGMETLAASELLDQAGEAMRSAQRGSSRHPFVYL